MTLRNRPAAPLVLGALLLAPLAAADYSILGGTVLVHTNGDPGATVTPAATTARVGPQPCSPAASFPVCHAVYGTSDGKPFGAFVAAGTPTCTPGSVCTLAVVLLAGDAAGTPVVLVGGGGTGFCNPQPADCAVVIAAVGSNVVTVQPYRNDEVASVCAWTPTMACYAATADGDVTTSETYACAGAAQTTAWYEVPDATCEGLRYGADPLCVETWSEGFDVICETRLAVAAPALP